MDLVRFGRGIRALRHRRKWRQQDLADAAGLNRGKIVRIELGQSGGMPVRDLEKVAQALGARLNLWLDWNGEALDRLLDADHARLAELVATMLRVAGWEVILEATFWIRGERGSVDVLAWHPGSRIVLLVEIKSVVPDQQAMLAAFDRKSRLGFEIARERGWQPVAVGRLLVIGDSRTSRRRVARHPETYQTTFPHRAVEVRRWLARPVAESPLHGLLFLSSGQGMNTRHRVRRS